MQVMFDGWTSIGRTVISGAAAYLALVAMLRVSGKRTLAKLNAFDLVVTVALGSTLSTITLSRDVPIATGIAGLAVLIGMQYAVAWVSVRSRRLRNAARSEPRLLARRGRFVRSALTQERVTEEEVLAVIRAQGRSSLADVDGVILESDGSISVVPSIGAQPDAMQPVLGFERGRNE
jgi:uncharacterized membrane protein YcaP (DUF421 family)